MRYGLAIPSKLVQCTGPHDARDWCRGISAFPSNGPQVLQGHSLRCVAHASTFRAPRGAEPSVQVRSGTHDDHLSDSVWQYPFGTYTMMRQAASIYTLRKACRRRIRCQAASDSSKPASSKPNLGEKEIDVTVYKPDGAKQTESEPFAAFKSGMHNDWC